MFFLKQYLEAPLHRNPYTTTSLLTLKYPNLQLFINILTSVIALYKQISVHIITVQPHLAYPFAQPLHFPIVFR